MGRSLWIGIGTGILAGIAADRFCVHKVLDQKSKEIERVKGNVLCLAEWMTMFECGESVEGALEKRGISAVAIYGMGILGSHLYSQLEKTRIHVKYIMDQKPLKGIYDAKICNAETKLEGIDGVIVTPVYQFEEIKEKICRFNNVQVLSLRELLDAED